MAIDLLLDLNGVSPETRGGALRRNPFLTGEQLAALEAVPPVAATHDSLLAQLRDRRHLPARRPPAGRRGRRRLALRAGSGDAATAGSCVRPVAVVNGSAPPSTVDFQIAASGVGGGRHKREAIGRQRDQWHPIPGLYLIGREGRRNRERPPCRAVAPRTRVSLRRGPLCTGPKRALEPGATLSSRVAPSANNVVQGCVGMGSKAHGCPG